MPDVDKVPITILWLMAGDWTVEKHHSAEKALQEILDDTLLISKIAIVTTVEGAKYALSQRQIDLALIAACAYPTGRARVGTSAKPNPRGGIPMIKGVFL